MTGIMLLPVSCIPGGKYCSRGTKKEKRKKKEKKEREKRSD
jgi:hypothetical protein